MNAVEIGWPLVALIVALTGAAAAVVWSARLGDPRQQLSAALRAVAQLVVVSLVIGAALKSLAGTAAFIVLMVLIASATSARRVTGRTDRTSIVFLAPIAVSVVPAVGLALVSHVVPFEPVAVLPVAGILIGGAMTATTLAGRRLVDELDAQRGVYDAALSVGLTRRQAVGLVGRPAASLALLPGLDQTRTVGLVTLPGAFVGVLLAGASPAHAGAAQVLVLVSLLFVQATAVAITIELASAGRIPVRGVTLLP